MVEPGRRCLGDRYELHQMIAAGGMGQVWRGTDIALHRSVAVKVLRSEYTGDPSFLARFRAEAQHAASLSHPNVAAVFDYGEEIAQDGTGETLAYLVMELVEGEPLSALLAREGALDADTTLRLLQQTAFALAEAHRMGLVHRDVKPGNILVRDDGSVKITDFGIAWSARSVALTRTGQVIGTPQYLSPEQAEGRLATPASDVYALGLIGYECLTGHPAFEGDNAVTIALKQVQQEPEPLPGALPPGVRTLITRALVKDPAVRIPDGAAFGAAVDDVLAGRSLPEPPAPATQEVAALPPAPEEGTAPTTGTTVLTPPAPRRGRRVALALLPLVALLAGAGIAAAVLQTVSDSPPASAAVAAEQRDSGSTLLRAGDYVGRPVDEVAEELTGLGLVVQLDEEPSADVPADQVTGVSPTGRQLRAGDVVVVRYAVPVPREGGSASSRTTPREALVTDAAPGSDTPADDGAAEEPTTSEPTLQAGRPSTTPSEPVDEPATPVDQGPADPGTPDPGTGTSGPGTDPGTDPGTTDPEPEPEPDPAPTTPTTTPAPTSPASPTTSTTTSTRS
ncbi:serine/threonine protein kinase [Blastococcus sp. TF02-09]|uniref:protein kinase domain-containing protein n=1 Tax=Blastococcus sp. TF02-09 TaxID=2250576 RepID=UPI000DEAEF55|nr:protein kinase [Blastococcus sp. TF02-9]RBY75981.1 serine/threonine protein kinase [Blastococcus sp. TF02-9]